MTIRLGRYNRSLYICTRKATECLQKERKMQKLNNNRYGFFYYFYFSNEVKRMVACQNEGEQQ